MKKTVLLILSILIVLLLAASPVLAADRVRVGEQIDVFAGTPDVFPANEPFHIAHGWGNIAPVPMGFILEVDGIEVQYDFIEKTVLNENPLLINIIWVHNFPEGMSGTHTFTGHWLLNCYSALQDGFVDECPPGPYPGPYPGPVTKTLVEVLTKTIVVVFGESPSPTIIQNPDNGHYYGFVELQEGVNWYGAKDLAEGMVYNGMSGHLATITSSQEQNFLVDNFPEIFPNYVWLGASDEAVEENWIWITGEVWNYTDWDPGEPNGGIDENCLDYSDYSDKWNDENCYRRLNFFMVEFSN